MEYGYFNDMDREYVITDPRTPVKWINYIGSLEFGGFVDQTGGSLICCGDPALNRIVKYIPQLPDSDFKGETLYIRIREKNALKIFSPYFVPTLDEYEFYECHVGLGYTRIISKFYGIRTEAVIFVPMGEKRVISDIRITNLNEREIELDLIPVVEYTHFDGLKQFTNADWVPQTMQSKCFNENNGYKILAQFAFMNRDRKINYLTSNYPVSSFESDRKNFLGDRGYGTFRAPLSLYQDELSCTEAPCGNNIGALMHHLGKFKKGEEKRIITQLGQCSSIAFELPYINKYRDEKNADESFLKLSRFWEEYLSSLQVKTPSPSMNTMLNIHNPRQCYITRNWSRYLSLYQLGFGARGIGFRDSAQDVMGIMGHAPYEGRQLIEMLLGIQKMDGSAMHQLNPLTMEANEGDSREMEDRPKYYSDDHLWIILAVTEYLKETGDFEFLEKVIPFYEKDKNNTPFEAGTVLEHLKRAVIFTSNDLGEHGLPFLGFADWNDTVNLPRGAESMFTANLYGTALKEMIELLDFIGERDTADCYREYYVKMKDNVNKYGWDGEWYVRYLDNNGKAVGSRDNDRGKIYVNAQSWSVISGFASGERARLALLSVKRMLNTRNGIKLSFPGYNGYIPEKGGITTYPPGAKENGGIFLHSNPWVIIAETILGNGNQAFEYYDQINPVHKNSIIDEYECEPYCYCQNILGDEHPRFGMARNSWLSGTSSWAYQAAVKYILGIQPTYGGIRMDPCIPAKWKEFKAVRRFRNTVYDIRVTNPRGICKGIESITVDGNEINENILPIFNDSAVHAVLVVMG